MKRTLATALMLCAGMAAFGQGTIGFKNGTLTKIKMWDWGRGELMDVPTTPGLLNYGVFVGTSSSSLSLVPTLGYNSTTQAGIIDVPNGASFPIPGISGGETVWMQIKGWDASFGYDWQLAQYWNPPTYTGSWFGQTDIRQVTLGPAVGPGSVIWQDSTGTSPNKFHPFEVYLMVPEPGTLSLAGLGAGLLLWQRWHWGRKR